MNQLFTTLSLTQFYVYNNFHDKWVLDTMARGGIRLLKEERPPMWMVSANILNKQSRTADKGWFYTWELVELLTTPRRKKVMQSHYRPGQAQSVPGS